MIARTSIDQVYDAARVEEVIGDFIVLKKSGTNFKGLSPFSQEKTPSFMVSPVKQIWKDFSSGKGGNVVAFLMEHEHFTYPEAIRYLAKKYNIELEETQQTEEVKQKNSERESMYLATQMAQSFFETTLWERSEGKAIGLTYFKERGFKEETIRQFGLGYAPEKITALSDAAKTEGYSLEFFEKTGLVIFNEERKQAIDRFRGRVIFPIRTLSGRVQGFGGRILKKDAKTAKYLNSPESDIYQKSKVLYGMYEAKKSIAREDCCYLVEGYTDVIQMHQSGVVNVVSSSGTALTVDQIRLIRRLTKNIVVLFDGDAAGVRASLRGIDLILEQDMHVKICNFPEGEDPDSFAKGKTQEAIRTFLQDQAQDFIQYKANLLLEESQNDPVKKADTVRDIVQSIAKIPDVIQREVYVQSCAQIMEMSEGVLFNALAQLLQKQQQDKSKRRSSKPAMEVVKEASQLAQKLDESFELEKQIIRLLLHFGDQTVQFEEVLLEKDDQGEVKEAVQQMEIKVYEKVFLDLQQDEIELTHPFFQKTYNKMIEQFQDSGSLQPQYFFDGSESEQDGLLSEMMMENEKYQLHNWEKKNIFVQSPKEKIVQSVTQTILTLRRYLIGQKITALTHDLETTSEETADVLEEISMYNELRQLVSQKLSRVI